jgi:hypothetical protein
MNLAPTILGNYAVTQLQKTAGEVILEVGSDKLGRKELAAVGCYNFHAARNLSAVVKSLQIPNLKYLFEHVPPSDLALPHMGVISLAVLGAAFEVRKVGGSNPLLSWVQLHAPHGNDAKQAMVTFHTLKMRELAEARNEKQAIKDRKQTRRNKAHKLRVARFGERQASA